MSAENGSKLSNPASYGGAGHLFESHVQATFVVLMLSRSSVPCLPHCSIVEIMLQGKIDGYETDDLIVITEEKSTKKRKKLLTQIKRSISFTQGDNELAKVLEAAWKDFNNPAVFCKERDKICLITGPLSKTDIHNVQWILEQARHTASKEEFFQHVRQAKFSPSQSGKKLDVIRHHLKHANNGLNISDHDLFTFLRHFNVLGCDLKGEGGFVWPLLLSHIAQLNERDPESVLPQIVHEVQIYNQSAGTITWENLPDSLKGLFKQPAISSIPDDLTIQKQSQNWNTHEMASDIALVNLIGAWDGKNEADAKAIRKLTGDSTQSRWEKKAQKILHLPNSPLKLTSGQWWEVRERADLWDTLGSHVFNENLDNLREIIGKVLTELDPSFDLPPEERYAACLHGKVLKYSQAFRKGLAGGLAMLASKPQILEHCSPGKAKATANLVVHDILKSTNPVLWGSLNSVLPLLAEASPSEFLGSVEKSLRVSPCPFDELFAQEGDGFTGTNYLTGLLSALEGLAWDEQYLVQVCVALAELAEHDPGGRWANRPASSLTTLLLPWLPQTMANLEKREAAVNTICQEHPDIGWKLIISLLPDQSRVSDGSYRPLWRDIIPEDYKEGVLYKEYWQQVETYSHLAISIADKNLEKLAELINYIPNLPDVPRQRLLEILSSDKISKLPESQKRQLWENLGKLESLHRRFASTDWALDSETTTRIGQIAKNLAPQDPFERYQNLFSNQNFDLYEENDDWKEQDKKLATRRKEAVESILESGISKVIEFAETVKFPEQVGYALGNTACEEIDSVLLPAYLCTDNRNLQTFVSAYAWSRNNTKGWPWADSLDISEWSSDQTAQFLCSLPFTKETWDRASLWLGHTQNEYWSKTNIWPCEMNEELSVAVDKLLKHKRPHAAIACLYHMHISQIPIGIPQCVNSLLSAINSEEPHAAGDRHHITELIGFLQEDPNTPLKDLMAIEWAYLQLLDRYHGVYAKTLETQLSINPALFCEMIQSIYRSNRSDLPPEQPTKKSKLIAKNSWRILNEWKTPPGTQADRNFNDDKFESWFQRVRQISTESGHLECALREAGKVLVHCPVDPSGLWIRHKVAQVLNDHDSQYIRDGYWTGWLEARGAHHVDPSGKPERDLAESFRQKASDVEDAGFQRLAVTLRELADFYDEEANRIMEEHKLRLHPF